MQPLRVNKQPLYLQARQRLLSLIEDGSFRPGERLPSEVALAAQLGISRPTLREALLRLEQEGVISRKHGVGTFVSPRAPVFESGLEVLESLERQARRMGLDIAVTHLNVRERAADADEREALSLPAEPPAEVLCVDRVVTVKGRPVAYLRDVVPLAYLRRDDLADEFSSSVLDVLLRRGSPRPATSHTEIVAEEADAAVAELLAVSQGAALLKLVGRLYDEDGQVLDYSLSYFVPGHFKFHVVRRVREDPIIQNHIGG